MLPLRILLEKQKLHTRQPTGHSSSDGEPHLDTVIGEPDNDPRHKDRQHCEGQDEARPAAIKHFSQIQCLVWPGQN